MTWDEWQEHYKGSLRSDTQRKFVQQILSLIPLIKPEDVKPHFLFISRDGCVRHYIDFLLTNDTKGYALPIECDLDSEPIDLDSHIYVQDKLITHFGLVLHVSKALIEDSISCIQNITQALNQQSNNEINYEIISQQRSALRQMYMSLSQGEDTMDYPYNYELTLLDDFLLEQRFNKKIRNAKPKRKLKIMTYQENIKGKIILLTLSALLTLSYGFTLDLIIGAQNNRTIVKKERGIKRPPPPLKFYPLPSELDTVKKYIPPFPLIKSYQARNYEFQEVKVCGIIDEVHNTREGLHIGFIGDSNISNVRAVILNKNYKVQRYIRSKRDNLFELRGRRLCVSGTVSVYRNRPQIIVRNIEQLEGI